jgi:phosphoribosylanthranilate isomerase
VSTPRIKICGITRREDAELAVAYGADAVGFVFWSGSPRHVTPETAAAIARSLPPFVSRVGVFVNAAAADVERIVRIAGLDVAQLHGDEAVDRYRDLGARIVKAVTLESDDDVARVMTLPHEVMPLVDAVDRQRRGGTGRLADWERAARLAARRPLMLAGGLTPSNVDDAIRTVQPWAIDVSSGVEVSPGIKSREKLAALIARVRAPRSEET